MFLIIKVTLQVQFPCFSFPDNKITGHITDLISNQAGTNGSSLRLPICKFTITMHPSVIRLAVGLFIAYPVLLVYRKWLRRQPLVDQHTYFAVSGIAVVWWIMGIQYLCNSLICILVQYMTLKCFGGTFWSTVFLFVFQLGFMHVGFFISGYVDGAINWDILHCILCLRLIGMAINVYDGTKPNAQLTEEQQRQALHEIPTLLETLSHCFFIGSCLVGPPHSIASFKKAMQRNQDGGDLNGSLEGGISQLIKGVLLLMVVAFENYYFAADLYLFSEDCMAHGLLWRRAVAYFCTSLKKCKLSGVSLMAEGSCIVAGLTFNGYHENGSIDWDGWTNVNLKELFLGATIKTTTNGNNIQVYKWVSFFVYKRLKFLKSKTTSKFLTLMFLYLWHGYHFGYFYFFFYSFVYQLFEADIEDLTSKSRLLQSLAERNVVRHILPFTKWVVVNLFFMVDGVLPFALLYLDKFLTLNAIIYPIPWSVFLLVDSD